MKMTRRVAMKAGLVSAVSVLSPPALRADELQYQGKKGIVPMSHHLDTPLAAQNGQLFIDDLYVFSEPDSKGNVLAVRLIARWMAARVTKAARVSARFS